MNYKLYPNPNGELTSYEIKKGNYLVFMDYTCPHCKKDQSLGNFRHNQNKCVRCGKMEHKMEE
jgi:ribosomal protein S27E